MMPLRLVTVRFGPSHGRRVLHDPARLDEGGNPHTLSGHCAPWRDPVSGPETQRTMAAGVEHSALRIDRHCFSGRSDILAW